MSVLADFKLYFLTLHILSMAIGLGGATVSDILFFKFLKDYKISKKEVEVLTVLKNVVMGAIIVIFISGFALYLPAMAKYNANPRFVLKAFITGVVMLNGFALHMIVAPHLIELDLHCNDSEHNYRRYIAFALGAVSVCSWYSVFFIAMLKTEMSFTFTQGLMGYVCLIAVAITCSQLLGMYLVKQACKGCKKCR